MNLLGEMLERALLTLGVNFCAKASKFWMGRIG